MPSSMSSTSSQPSWGNYLIMCWLHFLLVCLFLDCERQPTLTSLGPKKLVESKDQPVVGLMLELDQDQRTAGSPSISPQIVRLLALLLLQLQSERHRLPLAFKPTENHSEFNRHQAKEGLVLPLVFEGHLSGGVSSAVRNGSMSSTQTPRWGGF